MKDTNLCKCNNCGSILIDQNPQVNAPLYNLKNHPEAIEMQYMQGLVENDDPDLVWACPVCLTDGFLTDNIE
jgi:hypothetical protein